MVMMIIVEAIIEIQGLFAYIIWFKNTLHKIPFVELLK